MLKIENLTVRYGGITALRGVSIEVKEGETVLLVGANGAGKSSMINAVIGLVPTAAGRIRIQGSRPWAAFLRPPRAYRNRLLARGPTRFCFHVGQRTMCSPELSAWDASGSSKRSSGFAACFPCSPSERANWPVS